MDKKSKVLIAVFIVLVFVSIFLTFKRAFWDKNFIIVEEEVSEDEGGEIIE